MYHPGKVLDVFNPKDKNIKCAEGTTQALIEMWDENMIIFRASAQIAKDVKEGQHVLVDYSPVPVGGAPVPRHEIVAIISEAKGKKMLAKLKDSAEEKRKLRQPTVEGMPFHGKMIG